MALLLVVAEREERRAIRRERLFRDRTNPLDSLNDQEIYSRYRFTRNGIVQVLDRITASLEPETQVYGLTLTLNLNKILKFKALS